MSEFCFMDTIPIEECVNPESYDSVCLKCNKCGRFNVENIEDVQDYFKEKYKKANFRVVAGHWPQFKSKEEVDSWINFMESIASIIKKRRLV